MASYLRALASASSMVSPVTNCSPIIRMPRSTLLRTSGSPPCLRTRVSAEASLFSLLVPTSRPVMTRPQVAALTKMDGDWPTWAFQSPWPILSRMSASRVWLSGMRSSASARHISATPSWLESANSWISASTPPARGRARSPSLRRRASLCTRAWKPGSVSGESLAWASSQVTHSGSGRRQAAVRAARRGVCGDTCWAKATKGAEGSPLAPSGSSGASARGEGSWSGGS